MTLLDEVGHGQPIMPEARRDRDDEAHMRRGEAVERDLVALLSPSHRKCPLLFPFEEGSVHGGPDEFPANP